MDTFMNIVFMLAVTALVAVLITASGSIIYQIIKDVF